MARVEPHGEGELALSVRLVPRASRDEVVGWTADGSLKIRVTAAPVEEAANRELIKFLSQYLDVRKTDVRIASGAHSKTKRLIVPDTCKNRLLSIADI